MGGFSSGRRESALCLITSLSGIESGRGALFFLVVLVARLEGIWGGRCVTEHCMVEGGDGPVSKLAALRSPSCRWSVEDFSVGSVAEAAS